MTQSTPTPLLELFAERLLHGTTLADKLAPPRLDESPTSFDPGQCRPNFVPPLLPGRPPQLSLSAVSKRRSTHVFPTKGSLDNPLARGHVLHFFANHELLAIEIMALAILKFHDAPAGFVRGIYETILEEQKHMHLYIDRMNDLGVAFGEISLNGFFWNSLKDMSSPQEYAAAMSLTFEQANLDFSLHYENSFRTLGDLKTANILETIRRDEIGHVRHGLIWFDRWRDPSRTLWQEYLTHLKFPMTPMRAKGPTFDLEGRQRAGLPGDYIHTLEAFSSSKGRPPKVLWFNPSCEEEIRAKGLGYSPPTTVRQLTEDLSVLMMHFGHNDDLLMTTAEPSHPWLIQLRKLGFEIPEIIAPITTTDDTLKERKIAGLEPWGWSPAAHHQRQLMAKKTIRALVHDSPELWQETPPSRNIFSKTFAASLRGPKDLKGEVATDTELVLKACSRFSHGNTGMLRDAVVKSPYGSSGRNIVFVKPDEPVIPNQTKWLERQLLDFGQLLIEPWVERVADVSLQFIVTPAKEVKILGVTRFIVNPKGQYRGHLFGKIFEGLPNELPTLWHGANDGWLQRFEETARRIGLALATKGYHGPGGIDGFIYKEQNGLQFQSLSEINPRYTMGRVALEIAKHCVTKTPGAWLHLSLSDVREAGFESFPEFYAAADRLAPIVTRQFSSSNIQLESGVLFTNDPSVAKQILTTLFLGSSVQHLNDIFGLLNINIQEIKNVFGPHK